MDVNNKSYPSLVLKKMVVFPSTKASLIIEGAEITGVVERVYKGEGQIALLTQKLNEENSKIGVIAKILDHWELSPSILGLVVEGIQRVKILKESAADNMRTVEIEELAEIEVENSAENQELEALARSVLEQFRKVVQAEGLVPMVVIEDLQKEYISPEKTSDVISAVLKLDFPEKLELLETLDVKKRLELLKKKLTEELNIAETEQRIEQQIEKEVNTAQKEYILKERLKAIEKELGIFEEQKEYDVLEQKIHQAGLPQEAEKKILGEFYRLKQMPEISAEAPYIRAYLEWITELPWNKRNENNVDLKKAREVLDEDHYGLEKTKERVLEYLAVQKLTHGKSRGSILCFVGPPGTGKTSVGQSIARSLGRNFVRISLGGIRDEAEIRGHRRTYVGALPGRIIQGMRNAGTKNPIFMMDEIDKIGIDFRGDPAAALLEVLDPAQNNSFSDHYIEIPFDLSEVFFITTANVLDPVPLALRDRMEVIEFPGYTDEEKFHIAKKFLLPRVLSSSGLEDHRLIIENRTIKKIINRYTLEAGVRELERKLAEIARKIALQTAEGNIRKHIIVTPSKLINYLGPEEYDVTTREADDEVGVTTGLAWTPAGGEIIFIEAKLVPGKGNLTITGQLGEIMQESAKAALSYIRAKSLDLAFPRDFYYNSDIHIHVPSGAIPKDGPSAGVAIAAALASMLTKKKAKKEVALTGEITLSGKVLKVGGIKEKILAAHRAKVKIIVLPKDNEKNLIDVPREIRKKLTFKFVENIDEALKIALKDDK